jgi:putative membrane protein (TIGR04086 family)
MRIPFEIKQKKANITAVAAAVLACLGAIFICSTIFSAITAAIDVSEGTAAIMSSLALCAGCFSGAFTISHKKREHGLLLGILTGACVFGAVFVGGLIMGGAFTAGGFFSKALIIFICSAIGGIAGANRTRS